MKIWTVANLKGGVGKTTTSVSLAGLNALRGERVLLIDLDPQGSLSHYLEIETQKTHSSVYDLFSGSQQGTRKFNLIRKTRFDNIDIIPSSSKLSLVERKFSSLAGKGMFLSRYLEQLQHNYDQVYIDCAPNLGLLMINAFAACDHLIIPVQPEFLAVKGLEQMVSTINMIQTSKNLRIDYTIVPTMHDQRLKAARCGIGDLQVRFRSSVWHKAIPLDTQFREASRNRVPISHFALHSRGAQAYLKLLHFLNMRTFYDESSVSTETHQSLPANHWQSRR